MEEVNLRVSDDFNASRAVYLDQEEVNFILNVTYSTWLAAHQFNRDSANRHHARYVDMLNKFKLAGFYVENRIEQLHEAQARAEENKSRRYR